MTTPINRKSFIIHKDSLDILDKLSDEQAGKLFKAIHFYQKKQEIPALDFALDLVFTSFLNQFKRDDESYKITCEARKLAGSKGGKQKLANASNCKQKVANLADSESKSKNESKSESKNKNASEELINHNQNINVDFQEFWNHYTPIECNGRMVGKDSKKLAEEKYNKLRGKYSHQLIMNKLEKYLTNCKKNSILTKAVHRWLTTTDFNDNEECTSIVANTIATKQDLQKNQDAEIYKRFLERTNDPNYINYFK